MTSYSISQQQVDHIFLCLSNEQLLDFLRPVFFLKNSIGYAEAMVVSDSLKLYVRKEMRDLQRGILACNLVHCRQTEETPCMPSDAYKYKFHLLNCCKFAVLHIATKDWNTAIRDSWDCQIQSATANATNDQRAWYRALGICYDSFTYALHYYSEIEAQILFSTDRWKTRKTHPKTH